MFSTNVKCYVLKVTKMFKKKEKEKKKERKQKTR